MEMYGRERRKKKRRSIDRLSKLPDSILCHILSFLPTKTSVATSTLSRRWRFVWTHVPNLHFNCGEHEDDIDRVLLLHKLPSLKSFILDLQEYDDYDEYQVETWIIAAVDRGVQYIQLSVVYHNPLPRRLFTCETIVDLRLCESGRIPTLRGVCLPRRKNLWLRYVEFEDDQSLPCLLSFSPVLEYFRFRSYDEISLSSCYVCSPTVNWLCLEMLVPSLGPRKQGHRLEINTPALEYLSVLDDLAVPIEFGDLTSLIAADICSQHDGMEEDEILCCVSLLKFVDSLSHVKCLRLDLSYYITVIKSVFSAWTPSFINLTKLELTADCCFLSKFLEIANNLEILKFHDQTEYQINSQHPLDELTIGWIEPQQVPKCLLSRLSTIKIVKTVGTKHGLEIIRYLLRNAKVLKRMDITYPPCIDSEEKNELLQKISLFERGSKTCELVFTEVSSEDCEWDWEGIAPLGLTF